MADEDTGNLSKETLEKFRNLPSLDNSIKDSLITIVKSDAMDEPTAKETVNALEIALEQRKALAGPNGRVLVTDAELNPGEIPRDYHPKSSELDFRVAVTLGTAAFASAGNGNQAPLDAFSELARKGGLSPDQISKDVAALDKANTFFANETFLDEAKVRATEVGSAGLKAFAEMADSAGYAIDSDADRHQPLNSKLTAIFMSSMEPDAPHKVKPVATPRIVAAKGKDTPTR